MARVYYERLSDESASYLEEETSRKRAHTAMTLIFEAGPLGTREGGVDFARVRAVIESALADLPRLRNRIRLVPGDGHPVWVDDPNFNLDYHLRQSSLPRPGNMDQLEKTAARVAASRIDRSRPLWDCWVIEGLEGNRFALVLKVHKALAVEAGADLLQALLSIDDERLEPVKRRFRARPAPSPVELFTQEVLRNWSPSRRLLTRGWRLLSQPGGLRRAIQRQATSALRVMGYALRPAGASPFDGSLGPNRSFEMMSASVDDLLAVRRAFGGTLHDVVLALVAGTLRRFGARRLINPVTLDLRAVTPVLDAQGREARPWIVELPTWEAEVPERVRLVREQTRAILDAGDVATGDQLASGTEWNASQLLSIGARAVPTIAQGQIVVLQAPGPRKPLFFDGARLSACYAVLPLQDQSGLGVTALSYAGEIFIAFNADAEIVPDLHSVRKCLDEEIEAMLEAVSRSPRSLRAVGE